MSEEKMQRECLRDRILRCTLGVYRAAFTTFYKMIEMVAEKVSGGSIPNCGDFLSEACACAPRKRKTR